MRHRWILIVTVLVLVAACGKTKPSRFYNLSADDPNTTVGATGPTIGINPVRLPEYLNGSHIVVQSNDTRVEVMDYDRWVGELENMFERQFVAALIAAVPSQNVIRYPWVKVVTPEYVVSVRVFRFNLEADGNVVLDARWELHSGQTGRLATYFDRIPAEQPAKSGEYDFDAMALAMSKLVNRFAAEVANAIQAQESKK